MKKQGQTFGSFLSLCECYPHPPFDPASESPEREIART